MNAPEITHRTPDIELTHMLTDLDPQVAEAAQAEIAERRKLAGGPSLELIESEE